MASKSEIIDCIEALAVHCRPPLMSVEQRELWMRDWCSDLAEYPVDVIATACRRWRHSGSAKFPTAGQLMPLVRDSLPQSHGPRVEVWRELSEDEYRQLSVREKIRHRTILAHEARSKAGPMFRQIRGAGKPQGEHIPADQMPETWRRWNAVAESHEAEIARLRQVLRAPAYAAAE